ncbi:hypothetical protein RMN57_06270 [Kitasatospora sp. CM 4170]|uniref:Uncharacterized protein n=1 Tax=Kitasatospora aburaviensis TaxID=67265 RepID=A0ABW1EQT1_9ACTN|nr:hypothetical protein [Kitasatospora sp. CM 4170]WNM44340.1 hypothetical protein RMN57_06270 [Kitasatospora sp. CM 4170]
MTAHHPTRRSIPRSAGGLGAAPAPGAAGSSAIDGVIDRLRTA